MVDVVEKLPTEPIGPNAERLREIVADIRRQMADPNSPIYANRPDLIEATEMNLRATLLQAGVREERETPESLARRQHDEAFSAEPDPGLMEMLDERRRALEASHGETTLREMAATLRAEIGSDTYERLVAEARAGLNWGETLPMSALADLPTLRVLAGWGRFQIAGERARPR